MTACAFIHPPGYPTIISDLMVTGSTVGDRAASKIVYARKSICLGEPPFLLAFAGDVEHIKRCIEGLAGEIGAVESDRPARVIGDMLNRYNESIGRSAVAAIGFRVNTGSNINVLTWRSEFVYKTSLLNEIAASGSGAHWLGTTIVDAEQQIFKGYGYDRDPSSVLIEILGRINSELIHPSLHESPIESWGGYFEAFCLTGYKAIWSTPRWSHFAFVIGPGKIPRIRQTSLQLHYDPYKSEVHRVGRDSSGAMGVQTLPILDISGHVIPVSAPIIGIEPYFPEVFTVAIILSESNIIVRKTFYGRDLDRLIRIGDNRFTIGDGFLMSTRDEALASRRMS